MRDQLRQQVKGAVTFISAHLHEATPHHHTHQVLKL